MGPTAKPHKKRKKSAPVPEPVPSDSDEEQVEEEPMEDVLLEQDGEEEGDEEDTGQGEEASKKRKRRSNARAKMRGYRSQATRAGIGSRNTIQNVVGVEEIRRAAKFRPANLNVVSYDIDEFKRRLELSMTPLPASAAAALVPRVERLRRMLYEQSVARLIESGKMTLTASNLLPSVRCIEEFGDFSFILPRGLVQFAQTHDSRGRPINSSRPGRGGKAGPPLLGTSKTDLDNARDDVETVKQMKKMVKDAEKIVNEAKQKRAEKLAAGKAAVEKEATVADA